VLRAKTEPCVVRPLGVTRHMTAVCDGGARARAGVLYANVQGRGAYRSPMLRMACGLRSSMRCMVTELLGVWPTSPISPSRNGYTPLRPACGVCAARSTSPSA
jgi:hypothetical protein